MRNLVISTLITLILVTATYILLGNYVKQTVGDTPDYVEEFNETTQVLLARLDSLEAENAELRLENDGSTTCHLGTMQYYSDNDFFGFLMNLPVEMRAIPTATLSGSGKAWKASGNANGTFASLVLNKNSKTSLATNGSSTSLSDGSAGNATVITLLQSSYIEASAEL